MGQVNMRMTSMGIMVTMQRHLASALVLGALTLFSRSARMTSALARCRCIVTMIPIDVIPMLTCPMETFRCQRR